VKVTRAFTRTLGFPLPFIPEKCLLQNIIQRVLIIVIMIHPKERAYNIVVLNITQAMREVGVSVKSVGYYHYPALKVCPWT
jgi:hypothetical protein